MIGWNDGSRLNYFAHYCLDAFHGPITRFNGNRVSVFDSEACSIYGVDFNAGSAGCIESFLNQT